MVENYENEFPPLKISGLAPKPDNQVFNDKIKIIFMHGQFSVLWTITLFSEFA